MIERGLIIYSEPLEWIVSGKKVWEIRTKATKIRVPIALLEKEPRGSSVPANWSIA